MRRTLILTGFLLLVCLLPEFAQPDYLIVSRNATIKAEAHRDAEIRAKVTTGQYLQLLSGEKTNRYYEVALPSSDVTGYVYHTLARRYSGEIPNGDNDGDRRFITQAITPEFLQQNGNYMFLHFLDVDQGDAAIIEFPCGVAMVDAGYYRTENNDRVVRYLETFFQDRPHLRPDTIDVLFITHNHQDHTYDLRSVFDNFTVLNYVDNGDDSTRNQERIREIIRSRNLNTIVRSVQDTEFDRDNRQGLADNVIDPITCGAIDPAIHVLTGGVGEDAEWWSLAFEDLNNQSLGIRIDFGQSSVIFTGDMEEAGIERLLHEYQGTDWLDVDIYQAGHHGSTNASTPDLLTALSPELAVISMGDSRNESGALSAWAYGHPRREVVSMISTAIGGERIPDIRVYAADGSRDFRRMTVSAPVYGTGWDGDVVVKLDLEGNLSVATENTGN